MPYTTGVLNFWTCYGRVCIGCFGYLYPDFFNHNCWDNYDDRLSHYVEKSKSNFHPITGHEGLEGEQMYRATLPSTSAQDGGGWSMPHPDHFTPGKDLVPIEYEAGWAPGPVWTCVENLAPTGIWSPDCPAPSESLYQLRYPGLFTLCTLT
jgi:hypothetical protein